MTDEKMTIEMEKYTKALKEEKDLSLFDEKKYEYCGEFLDEAKEKAHKIAIECLDNILTPELKVFIRNLCLNKLGYPDEPIFYKIFGDYPKNGDRVSEESLAEKGISLEDYYEHENIWYFEGNYTKLEVIDGKTYIVLEELSDYSPEADSDQALEVLRQKQKVQDFVNHINNSNLDDQAKKKILKSIEGLFKDVKGPLIGGMKDNEVDN